ncbi:MAG: sporulation protein YunB [Bacillota bacterium]
MFNNKKIQIFILLIIFLILFVIIFLNKILYPVFFAVAEAEALQLVNEIINEAVEEEVSEIEYEDLIKYKCDNNGNIILFQQNTVRINNFSSKIALNIQKTFKGTKKLDIELPLGRLMGIDILAGSGPVINLNIIPGGFVSVPKIQDEFISAGINQTRHKLYLDLELELFLSAPFVQKKYLLNSEVPVVEVTILGKVPEVYFDLRN